MEASPEESDGVGSYLKNLTRAQDIAARTAHTIPTEGLQIPDNMLQALKNDEGVALFEARFQTNNPLILEIKKNDGTSIAEIDILPMNISEVESMYRRKFLNEELDGGTQGPLPFEPNNWPDADRNGKHFIFVHGYNVSGQQARGWHSETFKRLFWSESNAMFTGISWHGNESQNPIIREVYPDLATSDYWRNVHNAFRTSKSVADFVNALPGSGKSIAAHSLGNIVVSSAIKDHGLNVTNYYIIDAAAPIEAYSPGSTLGKAEMSHPRWRTYDERLWCSEWHEIFPMGDNRREKMTWRGRFDAFPNAYNFHSEGEDVLKNGDGNVPGAVGVATSFGVRAWVKNEMSKGFSFFTGGGLGHNGTGGWDFNNHWDIFETIPADPIPVQGYRRRTPSETTSIPLSDLEENPFFEPFVNSKFHDPSLGSAEAGKYDEVSKALSESLPALTFAAGANPIDSFDSPQEDRNFDMMTMKTDGQWPRQDGQWKHSDIRNVAFLYTYEVFKEFVELGGLDQ